MSPDLRTKLQKVDNTELRALEQMKKLYQKQLQFKFKKWQKITRLQKMSDKSN